VPAGSVAIANRQTAIYPNASPGGWHLVGVTPARFFDPLLDPPTLLNPGDRIRFRAIDANELAHLASARAA
jgi:inhibitor of KinA